MIAAVKRLVAADPALRFVVPVHPNPNVRNAIIVGFKGLAAVTVVEPQPYDVFVYMLASASAVLTDSGGLQEEGVALGKRIFIMRQTTERPEALRSGLATLVGTSENAIVGAVTAWASGAETSTAAATATAAPAAAVTGATTTAANAVVAASRLQRPGVRQTFGDGEAGKRSAVIVWDLLRTQWTDAVSLRAFQSCQHAGGAAALALPALASDHTVHESVWHDGLSTLLAGHQRFNHRVECSAQPPTVRVTSRHYKEIMEMPSTYVQ